MPFPVTVRGQAVRTPRELAAVVLRDAAQGGGTVREGVGPAVWLLDLGLGARDLVGLAAALIALPTASAAAEGARLAVALGTPELGPLLLQAAKAHDLGVLLARDVGGEGSVEDALLEAVARVADVSDADTRTAVLALLRQGGRTDLELPVLVAHGTADELAEWLPATLVERDALADDALAALQALAATDDDRGAAARVALGG